MRVKVFNRRIRDLEGEINHIRISIQQIRRDRFLIGVTTHPSNDPPRTLTRYEKKTYETIEEAEKAAEELTKTRRSSRSGISSSRM
jgi:hypothetical protein